jgi:filamentous hemagglutinin
MRLQAGKYDEVALDITSELLGVADAERCVGGSASGCGWLASSFIPFAKLGKILKLLRWGDEAAGLAEAAQRLDANVDLADARFAQTDWSENFSKGGLFGGQTIDDVAGALRSGSLSPKDVPINAIVRDGYTLILNTRSAQALTRAGIPRDSWNVVNRTNDPFFEALLTGQLTRNGLDSGGYTFPG